MSERISVSWSEPSALPGDSIELMISSMPYTLLPPTVEKYFELSPIDMREAVLGLGKDLCKDINFLFHKPLSYDKGTRTDRKRIVNGP